ncbi:MAG: glycosyltransferase family 39 protein [Anaerolineae bacterium]
MKDERVIVKTSDAHPAWGRWQSLAAFLLLVVMFAQLLAAATQLSMTIDEGFHITSGYGYLRTGQMRLMDEHVPLVKALFAWPLFFVPDLLPPEQAAGWTEGELISVAQETLLAYQPIDRVIVAPRVLVVLLTLLLAATVYRWAANWFGPTAGIFALALLTFDPNILAHGSLATTDMGAVAFIFWAVWAFARYLQVPTSWRRWWMAALLLGLAQGAKLTGTLLLPVLGLLTLIDAWMKRSKDKALGKTILRRTASYGGMVVVAAIVVWGLYLFEVRALPQVAEGTLPLPAASHIERWLRLRDVISYGRESFLLGQNGMHGWWQYFPVAFALKTPLPTLLFTALTIAALLFGRRRGVMDELALGLFSLLYAVSSLTSTINIGYRHLLPVLPFLFVSASRLTLFAGERTSRLTRCVLIAWLCIGTLSISPHYLAYFNSIAGGADQGYRFLADSNTDWGQALKALAEYQRRNNLEPVKLSTFTFLDPATYGVRYESIAPMSGAPPVLPRRFNPEPGLYAISATTLDGVPLPLPSMYDWFRHRAPRAKIGHVMFLYEVEKSQGNWVAQCMLPVAPLTAEVIAQGFGSNSLRQIYFDCEQSWVFPDGGASVGWYARTTPGIDKLRWPMDSQHLEWWPVWVPAATVLPLNLSYVQSTPGELPAFTILEWTGGSVTPPATIEQGDVMLDGTLIFLGYDAPQSVQQGASVDVLTYWRVVERPSRPLSLMLHLMDTSGVPIATGDGLGVPVDQWQPDDVIVQRHTLTIPADAPLTMYQLHSGAYWLDDMTRLMAGDDDSILLAFVELGH